MTITAEEGIVARTIRQKLEAALQPAVLDIVDDSQRHAGHMGARPEGETHFNLRIIAAAFAGQSRLERQRMIYELLAEEMRTRVHALAMVTLTPEEAAAKKGWPT